MGRSDITVHGFRSTFDDGRTQHSGAVTRSKSAER